MSGPPGDLSAASRPRPGGADQADRDAPSLRCSFATCLDRSHLRRRLLRAVAVLTVVSRAIAVLNSCIYVALRGLDRSARSRLWFRLARGLCIRCCVGHIAGSRLMEMPSHIVFLLPNLTSLAAGTDHGLRRLATEGMRELRKVRHRTDDTVLRHRV